MDRLNLVKGLTAVSACILALSTSVAYSGTMGPAAAPDKVYLGVFGGGGAVDSTRVIQYGTAFFTEEVGGPLAVNAVGRTKSDSNGMVGGHIGYSWPETGMYWPIVPAVELEGYYIGGVNLHAYGINNTQDRLVEHNFDIHLPLKSGVFLVNAVLNSSNQYYGVRPYVGVGIGAGLVTVSGATSIQLSPPEVGVNHFGVHPHSSATAFAAQPKVGLRYDLNASTSIYAEYRYLYLSETHHTFGSTVAAGHVPTTPWLVKMKSQSYNMGTVGIDFDI